MTPLKSWNVGDALDLGLAITAAIAIVNRETRAGLLSATVEGETPKTVRLATLFRERLSDGSSVYELVLS